MEHEFVRWLNDHVPSHPSLQLGIGDDAAVLADPQSDVSSRVGPLVVTTDLVSDGVDFRLTEIHPRQAGRKALAVNLSDLAAMAARPVAAVIAVAIPARPAQHSPLELAIAVYEGLLPLATTFDVAIAGGDTNLHDGPLVISITAIGETLARGPLTRQGGRPGDRLLVTGQLGGSILGHHFDFTPRVQEALQLHQDYDLHAGLDISDGLALDAARLAAASQCGAVLDVARVPVSAAARELSGGQPRHTASHKSALQHALGDGEDFELLLAVPPDAAEEILLTQPLECRLTDIGELVIESGLWQLTEDGSRTKLDAQGYVH